MIKRILPIQMEVEEHLIFKRDCVLAGVPMVAVVLKLIKLFTSDTAFAARIIREIKEEGAKS